MSKIIRLLLLIGLLIVAFIAIEVQADAPSIKVLRVEGTIVPIVADYIDRGISQAEDENATA
ncbi:unnamed protein product, partial [marine sediment metagenome]